MHTKGEGWGQCGEAGAPYPEAFNLQRKGKKKVWHHFFLLHKRAKIPTCLLFVQCWTKPGSGGQASLVLPLHSRDTLPQTGPISPTLYLLKDNQKTELSILSISSKPGQLVYMLTTQ